MSFCEAVRAWPALHSAEADDEALAYVLMLESASSLAVSLTRSARRSVLHTASSPCF